MHEQMSNNFINTVVTKCDDSAITIPVKWPLSFVMHCDVGRYGI